MSEDFFWKMISSVHQQIYMCNEPVRRETGEGSGTEKRGSQKVDLSKKRKGKKERKGREG